MPLRPLTEPDLPLILAWRNAPEVRMHMYSTHEINVTEHRQWFARIRDDPRSRWYLHENEERSPDGVVYFSQYSPENQSSFWGFYTAPSAPRGTGTLLGINALDEAFINMNLHKLNAEILEPNIRSLAFHKKLGFQEEGLFRDYHFDGIRYVDVVRMGILGSEWERSRKKLIIDHPGSQ
ncbi:MAG TPA: UDP-4-amino-4,6-dideoxy-N-acetyl-beta-L-altrosamine N-acetyltransferase [Candidimonas sp.]|nr:UDP-4-amino-4,6-dideoxy-N-acetyl-beta-L-altrosamine N-acetyltransferase [Candidimonas sp.]